jgi:hypothetical protein
MWRPPTGCHPLKHEGSNRWENIRSGQKVDPPSSRPGLVPGAGEPGGLRLGRGLGSLRW